MRYEDYNIENMTFTNKTEWTEAEMQEVLDTFPETRDIEKTLETLRMIKADIDNGTIKLNQYGEINKASARAYANKHDECDYGYTSRYCVYDKDRDFYIYFDGRKSKIRYASDIDRMINSASDIERRFDLLLGEYVSREKEAKEKREKDNYLNENADRIDANQKAYALLKAVNIKIPTSLDIDRFADYSAKTKELSNLDLWTNSYGEMKKDDAIISQQTAEELTQMVKELSKELSDIIDIYNGKYKDIIRRNAV